MQWIRLARSAFQPKVAQPKKTPPYDAAGGLRALIRPAHPSPDLTARAHLAGQSPFITRARVPRAHRRRRRNILDVIRHNLFDITLKLVRN